MARFSWLAAVSGAVLAASCGIGAPTYPSFGETAYRVEGMTLPPDGGAATPTVIYRDGPKMRVEAMLPQYGQATIVFDDATNSAYVLNPTTGPYAPAAAPTAGVTPTAATPAPTSTPAAPAPGVAAPAPAAAPAAQAVGIAVRVPDADAPQPLESAWAALGADNAESVGACQGAGENGHSWRAKNADQTAAPRIACITDDGIILSIRENDRVLWQATALQRGTQDAALFGVPQGYRLIDPQAVAEQVSDTLQQLDSVTGDAPPPATP
ncbi:MAG: hypothetical protein GC189_08105 [Alphaproteobacteria bacterium]|nr:hypothetical protein [Alphaproteobacteria bacterium]